MASVTSAGWLATGPFGGAAEVVRTTNRPGFVVAATRNGFLYESSNGGASWSNRPFPPQMSGILHAFEIDPRDANLWFVGMETTTGAPEGLHRSTDAGRSWQAVPDLKGEHVWALAIFPGGSDVVAAGTGTGVFLSSDRGIHWRRISRDSDRELKPVVSLAFHPTDRNIIYAGTTHLPWRTIDGGAHWESIHEGMFDDSDVFSMVVDGASPEHVFASACSGVYRSADAGSSWSKMPTPKGAFRTYLVSRDVRRANVLFAATNAGLLRSADRGASWRQVSPHVVKSVAYDPASPDKIYFASESGGLLVSRDGGVTLVEFNTGFSNRNFAAIAGAGNVLYAASIYEPGSGGLFRSDNRGLVWRRMAARPAEGNLTLLAVAPDDPKQVYGAGAAGVYESRDGGDRWSLIGQPPAGRVTALHALAGRTLLAGTSAGLYRHAAGAWNEAIAGSRVERIQSSGARQIAVMTSAAAYASAGAGWRACGQPAPGTIWYGLAFSSGTALAATARGLFRSQDGCATWKPVADFDRATVSAVAFDPASPGAAIAARDGRVWHSADAGRSWIPLDDGGRTDIYPRDMVILASGYQRLYALVDRRGVLAIPLPTTPGASRPVSVVGQSAERIFR